eukprot:12417102-Karenia_brevis.AAC.1
MEELAKKQKEMRKKQALEEKDLNRAYLRIQNLEASLEEEKDERRKTTQKFEEEMRRLKLDLKEVMLELKVRMAGATSSNTNINNQE